MPSQLIKIKPLSPVFFKGGKPFPEENGSWVASMPLPYPSVIWGALFSHLLSHKKVRQEDVEKLSINCVWLFNDKENRALIPAPLDVFQDKADSKSAYPETYVSNRSDDSNSIVSNAVLNTLIKPKTDRHSVNVESCFIDFHDYVDNYPLRNGKVVLRRVDDFSVGQRKLGIAIDGQLGAVEEGKLYQIEMRQFYTDWSIAVSFNGPEIEDGVLKIGGEGKVASFEKLEEKYAFPIIGSESSSKYLKVLFHSPALFDCGNGIKTFNKTPQKLISAAIGKPLMIGGYDMASRSPKPMRIAVPSGSVYLFEATLQGLNDMLKNVFKDEDDNRKGFNKYSIISF